MLRAILAEHLKFVLGERSLSDDAASAVFQERDLAVVLRLRRENGRRILIVDDGKGDVRVTFLRSLKDLEQILPSASESDQIGYEYARRVICRALSDR